jgi:hypothetical protein
LAVLASQSEAGFQNLQFSQWRSIFELVQTHFASCGGEDPPAKIRKRGEAAPLKTAKEPDEKHRPEPYFNFGGRKFNHMNSMEQMHHTLKFTKQIYEV